MGPATSPAALRLSTNTWSPPLDPLFITLSLLLLPPPIPEKVGDVTVEAAVSGEAISRGGSTTTLCMS